MNDLLDKSILLILGKDRFFKDQLVADAEKKVVSGAFGRDFNYNIFRGAEANLGDILDSANTLPVMAERRLVVVRDFDLIKDCEKIFEFYANPSDTTLLMLCSSDGDYFWTLNKAFEKKFSSLYGSSGSIKKVYDLNEGEIKEWLRDAFRRQGRTASEDVLAYMMEIVGEKLIDLNNEVVKVCGFNAERKEIDLDDLRKVLSRSTEASIEKIRQTVLKRDIASVLRQYYLFYARSKGGGDLILLLSDLSKYFRNLLKASDLMTREGLSKDVISGMPEFKLFHFSAKNIFLAALNNFRPDELQHFLTLFHPLDKILKSYPEDIKTIYFERFLMALCRRRAR
jgi:DNA polymerase III subunit delta